MLHYVVKACRIEVSSMYGEEISFYQLSIAINRRKELSLIFLRKEGDTVFETNSTLTMHVLIVL